MSIKLQHSDSVDHSPYAADGQGNWQFDVWLEVEVNGKTQMSRPTFIRFSSDDSQQPQLRPQMRQIVEEKIRPHITSDDPKTAQAQLQEIAKTMQFPQDAE